MRLDRYTNPTKFNRMTRCAGNRLFFLFCSLAATGTAPVIAKGKVTEPRSGISLVLPDQNLTKREDTLRGASFTYARGRLIINTLQFGSDRSLEDLYKKLTQLRGRVIRLNEFEVGRRFAIAGRDRDGMSFLLRAEAKGDEVRAVSAVWSPRASAALRKSAQAAVEGALLFAGTAAAAPASITGQGRANDRPPGVGFRQVLPDQKHHPDPIYDAALPCNYRLDGPIGSGLFEQVARIEKTRIDIVCLNSPGGSFAEAVKVAGFFKKEGIATKIEAGDRCESACALIFMAGTWFVHEDGYRHWRVLHPAGRLGFHAPKLVVRDGDYAADTVGKAYDLALQTLAAAITEIIMHGDSFQEGAPSIKASLLAAMLGTPSNRMLYVDTVDKAGRWGIDVAPIATDRSVKPVDFAQACNSHMLWLSDKSAISATNLKGLVSDGFFRTEADGKARITIDEMAGSGCMYEQDFKALKLKEPFARLQIIGGRSAALSAYQYFPPETPIASFASER